MAHERIEINPGIMGGKPVIRGTRIPVETVLRKLGAGIPDGGMCPMFTLCETFSQTSRAFSTEAVS